jgi:predicted TIM-barrel fold metal-dependent hydrolase
MASTRIIDGDGHVLEDGDGIARFVAAPYQYRPFPPLDHLHSQNSMTGPGSFRRVNAQDWIDFMDDIGIETAVLYPTGGLACGKITNRGWAIALTRAYNDWLSDAFMSKSPRLKGMALIPMQDPEAAVEELRRAVAELGMCGAMLPSTGLKGHLGSKEYWPVYEEAERLGCCLGVHGGAHEGLGFDDMNVHVPVPALGHPFGQMISFAGILFNRIYDRYPGVRIGFLEGGVGWLPMLLERFDRVHETHTQVDPREEILLLSHDEKVSDYIVKQIKEGRIFIGCEGNECTLVNVVEMVGSEPLLFSSDFPHEVNNDYCKREIDELLENERLTTADKEAILHHNAERFYRFQPAR